MSMRCADVAGIDRHQPLLVEQLLGNQELIPSEGLELPAAPPTARPCTFC